MSIVVTAASGQLGTLVVHSLIQRGIDPAHIVATGRSTHRLEPLRGLGVRTAELNYSNPPAGVVAEGDTVLLISGSEIGQRIGQHRNVIELARRAHAARVVYTSCPRADSTTLAVAPEHAATETTLATSGVPYTVLRNGWYNENYEPTFAQAAATGTILTNAGDGRVSSASRQDYAEAAAAVLTSDGHDRATYELGGDTAWTMRDLAVLFTKILQRPLVLENLTRQAHHTVLLAAGLDEATAGFLVELDQNTADGELLVETGDLSRLIGRPTTPIDDTARAWLAP